VEVSAHEERTSSCCGVPASPVARTNAQEAKLCLLWNTVDTEHGRTMVLRLFLSTWAALGAHYQWVDSALREAHVPAHVVETLVKQYRNETGPLGPQGQVNRWMT
jgi:hypothetical protein